MNSINNPEIALTIKTHLENYEVISFDIFDTLLLRPYVKPEDLFYHLEKLHNEEGFAVNRIQADAIARAKNSNSEEITLNQIYEVLNVKYHYLKQHELELEELVLSANPEILEIYNYTKSRGKKIIITSDMYLPKDFIEKLLQKHGYNGYNKLYLSNELNKRKSTGNLYTYILNDLKITSGKILHIGDNMDSDCKIPNTLGITAFYYEKIMLRYLEKNPRMIFFIKKNLNNVGASIILGVSAIKSLNIVNDYWENFGYEYGGPLVYGYTQWLYHQFKANEIKDALFIARDGYTLKKVFDLFGDKEIKTHYFYAPRLFYLALKLNPESKIAFSEMEKLSATKFILNYYKNKNSFLEKNTPEINHSQEGLNFIKSNTEIYQELVEKEVQEYTNYISSLNLDKNNIAIIDSISLSLSSQKLVSMFTDDKKILGFYLWFDKETQKKFPEYICNAFQIENIEIINPLKEFILTAPELPIQSVFSCKPVYKSSISRYEQTRINAYPKVSNGALEFAKDIIKLFKQKPIFIEPAHINDLLITLGQHPEQDDINYLKEIYHCLDSNHSVYTPLLK